MVSGTGSSGGRMAAAFRRDLYEPVHECDRRNGHLRPRPVGDTHWVDEHRCRGNNPLTAGFNGLLGLDDRASISTAGEPTSSAPATSCPLHLPDLERRRHDRGTGAVSDRIRCLDQGRVDDKAVGHVTGASFVDALVSPDVSQNTPNINGVGCTPNGCLSPIAARDARHGPRRAYAVLGVEVEYPRALTRPDSPVRTCGWNSSGWATPSRRGCPPTGSSWTKIGSTTLAMTNPVTIGLFDTATQHRRAEHGCVRPRPSERVDLSHRHPGPPSITLAPSAQSASTGVLRRR